ncbi:CFAP44, partial [Symbiodinium sp. KB8]
ERLDLEEVMGDLVSSETSIQAALDRHRARQGQVASDLNAIRREIAAFQSEKQGVLNKLTITVPLAFSQVYLGKGCVVEVQDAMDGAPHPEPLPRDLDVAPGASIAEVQSAHRAVEEADRRPVGQVPPTLASALLMKPDSLADLRKRVGSLQDETHALREGFTDLRKAQRRLKREHSEAEADIAATQTRTRDLQVLKFGQPIDIQQLDKAGASAAIKAAEGEVGDQELTQRGEARRLQGRISEQQAALVEVTRANTQLLEAIAGLSDKQASLEGELDDTQGASALLSDESAGAKEAAAEKARLRQLVALQAAEMEALRGEVFVLRHKGGFLYAPRSAAGSAAAAVAASRAASAGSRQHEGLLPPGSADTLAIEGKK